MICSNNTYYDKKGKWRNVKLPSFFRCSFKFSAMKQGWNSRSVLVLATASFFLLYTALYSKAVQKVHGDGSLSSSRVDYGNSPNRHILNKDTIVDYRGDESEQEYGEEESNSYKGEEEEEEEEESNL